MNRLMKGTLIAAATLLFAGSLPAGAADAPAGRATFYKDILPIFQQNCQACHRPFGANLSGMIAPMPLMTYKETRPWARAIMRAVEIRTMPPWHASEEFHGVFKQELTLTEQEIATVVGWAKSGAPAGNRADAPAPIDWPETGWAIGEPDLIVTFSEPNWVGDEVDDKYQNVTVQLSEEQMPEPRWIQSIEFKPGSEAVHHIIAYAGGEIGDADEEGARTTGMIGGEAPGTDPSRYPDGYGVLLPRAPSITFQMHYHKEKGPGTGVWDNSSFGIKFHDKDKPVVHAVQTTAVAHGDFEIPPGHKAWKVSGSGLFERDTTILGFMPHLHLRGVAAKYTAFYPDGTSEVLLDVPNYDFNWQRFFEYNDLKQIPAGTRVEFEMVYDNSAERGQRIGFNSARPVRFGGPTWDEMDLGWMSFTDAVPVTNLKKSLENRASLRSGRSSRTKLDVLGKEISVSFGRLGIDSEDYKALEKTEEGSVYTFVGNRATKLTSEVDLKFGDTVIRTGNVAEGYAGVYSLWLKKTSDGWSLVFNNEADIWGSRHEAAADVAEVPLILAKSETEEKSFKVELKEQDGGGLLRIAWGPNEWTTGFTLAQ